MDVVVRRMRKLSLVAIWALRSHPILYQLSVFFLESHLDRTHQNLILYCREQSLTQNRNRYQLAGSFSCLKLSWNFLLSQHQHRRHHLNLHPHPHQHQHLHQALDLNLHLEHHFHCSLDLTIKSFQQNHLPYRRHQSQNRTFQLFNYKIDYHNREDFSNHIRFNKDIEHSKKRINELTETKNAIKKLLSDAKAKGINLVINSTIAINLAE